MPVKVETTPMLPGLSPVCGKAIVARFDGASMSSDGGLPALREVGQRLGIASRLVSCLRNSSPFAANFGDQQATGKTQLVQRFHRTPLVRFLGIAALAACIDDPRDPSRVIHGLDEIIRTRMLMIASGYEDGNDADRLRADPMFKLAMGRLPGDADLCSQPTISRLENLPDARALLRMGRTAPPKCCASAVPDSSTTRWASRPPRRCASMSLSWKRALRPALPPRPTARNYAGSRSSTTEPQGTDTRFVVTSIANLPGRTVYQDIYCARGQAENHIKAWKTHLAADRTSCCRAAANQMRLFLHVGAYWLMWSLRALMPRRSRWRVAQFDTLRLRQ